MSGETLLIVATNWSNNSVSVISAYRSVMRPGSGAGRSRVATVRRYATGWSRRTISIAPDLCNVAYCRWSQPVDATLYLRGKRWSVAMDREFRRGFTTAEKTELWDRWQRGESLKAIGRAFGKPSSSIYFQVSPYGGIRPAPRRRSRLALTLSEREEISRGNI